MDVENLHDNMYERKISEIETISDKLVDSIEMLTIDYKTELGDVKVQQWNVKISEVEHNTKAYGKQIRMKAAELRGPVPAAGAPTVQHPLVHQPSANQGQAEELRKAKVKVSNAVENIKEDVLTLGEEVNKILDWGLALDHEVSAGVRQVKYWKERFQKIQERTREVKEISDLHNLDDNYHASINTLLLTLKGDLEAAVSNIEYEDGPDGRCLYSCDKNKSAMVQLPKFDGDPAEDFSRFRFEMEKALRQNRVTRADQVAKLRDSLSGHAKSLVPNTMLDINTAWEVLNTAFGDSARVMQARKEKIVNLGPYPAAGRSSGPLKKQVEWLLELELSLKDIIDLGHKNSDMDREAFSGGTISKILALFPLVVQATLTVCKGDGKERMLGIVEEIAKLRVVRQELLRTAELAEGFNSGQKGSNQQQGNSRDGGASGGHGGGHKAGGHQGGNHGQQNGRQNSQSGGANRQGGGQTGGGQGGHRQGGGQSGGGQGGHRQGGGQSGNQGGPRNQPGQQGSGSRFGGQGHNRQPAGNIVTLAGVLYAPHKRDEGCRVCGTLEARGDTANIYEDHRSNYATGCPRFAAMTTQERRAVVQEAKLCFQCLDPDFVVTWSGRNNPHPACKITDSQRSTYTCRSKKQSACRLHMWICMYHADDNKAQMTFFRNQWLKKGGQFVLTVMPAPDTAYSQDSVRYAIADIQEVDKEDTGESTTPSQPPSPLQVCTKTETAPIVTATGAMYPGTQEVPQSLSQATEVLRQAAGGTMVRDVPRGEPLFMFSTAVGRTRPLNVFYDRGCSHVCFRRGVPEDELESHLITPGPIFVTGVGNTTVEMKAEHVVLLDRSDGTKQAMVGVESLGPVTATFPTINLKEAVKDIKGNDPANLVLQNLRVPEVVGGTDVDILLGIHYECLHPVPVHRLECGLTIFQLKIATPDNLYDAVIGGPHETFQVLANQAGNSTNLLAHFVQGLATFRELGPPKLKANPMTIDEMELADLFNRHEMEKMAGCPPEELEDEELSVFTACVPHGTLSAIENIRELDNQRRLFSVTRGDFLSTEDNLEELEDELEPEITNCYRAGCSPCTYGCIEHPPQVRNRSNSETHLYGVNVETDRFDREQLYVKDAVLATDYFTDINPGDEVFARTNNPIVSQDSSNYDSFRACCSPYLQGGIEQPSEVRVTSNPIHLSETFGDDNTEQDDTAAAADASEKAAKDRSDFPCDLVICNSCGDNATETTEGWTNLLAHLAIHYNLAIGGDGDDQLLLLKMLAKLQEGGLTVEYRCPRCRNCSDCRNAIDTEKISLREEAEDQAVKDSVSIDWKAKKITCTLPLRGREEDFLTSNREIALKVLNQQCIKYYKNKETKETVIKAFKKLFDNDYACLFSDLPASTRKKMTHKPVQHYIPWRVVFKASISTPCRPVMDASTKTRLGRDGKGGRCLNDLVVKGRVVTLNLLRLLLRFQVGLAAVAGDLKQFYTSIGLNEEQWNLQRCLWREDLNPEGQVLEVVIKTLIYGVRCVSAQSECAMVKLADAVRPYNPKLADFILISRYVDDLGDSMDDMQNLKMIVKAADELFESVGLRCKGWSFSGENPHPDTTDNGESIDVAGMSWATKLDTLEVKVPPLHFGKKSRGKLVVGTDVFEGDMSALDKFVPVKITRRQVFSKYGAFWDVTGKFTPVTAGMKLLLRDTVAATDGWDGVLPSDLRSKWVKELWRLEKLKGIRFTRPRMPLDAVDSKMRLIAACDASNSVKIMGVWAGFKRKGGMYSSQLLIGRSLLSREYSTIPKEELEALTAGSNLLWMCRSALGDWVTDYLLIGDSSISICWVCSERKRLSLFHRNRTVQVRRGTDLDKIFHVQTDHNPADLGTRPDKVVDADVGPGSCWEVGKPWMTGTMESALALHILTPSANLKVKDDEKEEFNKGLVFEQTPEILVRGHPIHHTKRVDLVSVRAEFSNYLLLPTRFGFAKTVRVTAYVFKFINAFKCLAHKKNKPRHKFTMMQVSPVADKEDDQVKLLATSLLSYLNSQDKFLGVCWGAERPLLNMTGFNTVPLHDADLSRALEYLFTLATREVKQFVKKETVSRLAVEQDDILFCRSRLLDGQKFIITAGLEESGLANCNLNMRTPLVDRHSPLAYSIADFVHRVVCKHRGYETCYRMSLNFCHIIQGMGLFKELAEDCVKCKMLRKKCLEVAMGPINDAQLTIAPPFYATMADMYGPLDIYVPGFERKTRNRQVLSSKVWVLVFCCPVTKLLNLQVIETKSADGVVDGLTRLGCEVGFPNHFLIDQDSSLLKVLKEAEVDLLNLQLLIKKEFGTNFTTCPVSGHNFHGLVERKIRSVDECLNKSGVSKMILHATGLQTLLKLIENDHNNLPMGYSFGRSDENTPLLRLLTPNFMKLGRIHSRTLSGPVKLPSGPGHMMKRVEDGYKGFYKLWNELMVPHLIKPPKWFRTDRDLAINDVVYFQKSESDLTSVWTVGQVEDVVRGKDGLIRRVLVRYFNATEDQPRYTDRAVRSIVKLFDLENTTWRDDMDLVQKMLDALGEEAAVVPPNPAVPPLRLSRDPEGNFRVAPPHEVTTVCDDTPPVHHPHTAQQSVPVPPDHLPHTVTRPSDDLHPTPQPPHTPGPPSPQPCCCSHCELSSHNSSPTTLTITNSSSYSFPFLAYSAITEEESSFSVSPEADISDWLLAVGVNFDL